MGFKKWQPVSGQTYSRKYDYLVLSALSGLAQSAYKMCGDIRLLASFKEIGVYFLLAVLCACITCIVRLYCFYLVFLALQISLLLIFVNLF